MPSATDTLKALKLAQMIKDRYPAKHIGDDCFIMWHAEDLQELGIMLGNTERGYPWITKEVEKHLFEAAFTEENLILWTKKSRMKMEIVDAQVATPSEIDFLGYNEEGLEKIRPLLEEAAAELGLGWEEVTHLAHVSVWRESVVALISGFRDPLEDNWREEIAKEGVTEKELGISFENVQLINEAVIELREIVKREDPS